MRKSTFSLVRRSSFVLLLLLCLYRLEGHAFERNLWDDGWRFAICQDDSPQ